MPSKRLETHNNVAKSPTASTSSPGFHHTQRRYRFSPQDTTACFQRCQDHKRIPLQACEKHMKSWMFHGGLCSTVGLCWWERWRLCWDPALASKLVVGCRRLDSKLLQMRPAIVRHLIYSSLRISFYEAGVCVCWFVSRFNFNLTCLDAAVPHPLFITK